MFETIIILEAIMELGKEVGNGAGEPSFNGVVIPIICSLVEFLVVNLLLQKKQNLYCFCYEELL